MMRFRAKGGVVAAVFAIVMLLVAGCGLFGPNESSAPIDPPPDSPGNGNAGASPNPPAGEGATPAAGEITQVVYLKSPEGYIVPWALQLPKPEGNEYAKQVLAYMVKGGPVEGLLPEGFSAVLPEGTKVLGLSIKDGVATVDFSKEFAKYSAEDERKILEAVTWALTEFDNVQRVVIWLEGKPLNVMPVGGTPVNAPLSRADGINLELADNVEPGRVSYVTLYFQADVPSGKGSYFVPITRGIPKTEDLARATLEQLIIGPRQESGLYSAILPSTRVLGAHVDKGVAVANFDDKLLAFSEQGASPEAIQSIVLSLTETTGTEQVLIQVNGKSTGVKAAAMDLSKPVARPAMVNPLPSNSP